jgi:hypothetical protein
MQWLKEFKKNDHPHNKQELIILKEKANLTWGPNWNVQYDQQHVVGELEQLTLIIPKLIWVFNIKGVN